MMISIGVSRIEKHQMEKSATRSTSMVKRLSTWLLLPKLASSVPPSESSSVLALLSASSSSVDVPAPLAPATSLRCRRGNREVSSG